jgi:hypothetical protein
MACRETTEARLEKEKPASVDTTSEVARYQEVPVENAEVMPVGGPGKRSRDRRHLASVRRQKKKDQNLEAGVAGRDRNEPRGKMGAEETWSLPSECRTILHDAEFY